MDDFGFFSSVARITPAGTITEFSLSNSLANPCNIVAGPDGNLWFTECNINGNAIGRITPAGLITEFLLPGPLGVEWHYPNDITAGPDGKLWFTYSTGAIGRITTKGVITKFNAPGLPWSIAAGPDGNLWFLDASGMSKIWRISTTGVITEFLLPTGVFPTAITSGPDGNLWFTESVANRVGKMNTEGTVTEFVIPTALSEPSGIAAGPDGNIWFVEAGASRIGRVDINHPAPCSLDTATLCLNGGRFQVQVNWRAPSEGTSGSGQALPMTAASGSFWFFSPDNIELVVKVLDGRDSNGKFWVFYGSLTNVEFTLTVSDTLTGAVRTYFNPQGQMASVADTSAF